MKKALIFTGDLETSEPSTSVRLTNYLKSQLQEKGTEVTVFNIANSGIPLFETSLLKKPPLGVQKMYLQFQDADFHIWLTPLYHGSMTGVMKNCLDWLEISANEQIPYLTGKIVGLVCWADGVQALHGINAMDSVAKALRAWVAPYSIAIQRKDLFDEENLLATEYEKKFKQLIELLTWECY